MTDIVQLARLAIQGKQKDAQVFIRRLARRYEQLEPELSAHLSSLLRQVQKPMQESSPVLRGAVVESMPVDMDSRLSLARVEHPVHLEYDPSWSLDVRTKLNELVYERSHEEDLRRENLSPARTTLFTGPPGVGKTLAARWIARQLERPLVTLDLSAVMSSFLGRTGNNVRNVIDYAKGVSCVFLLDEFDAIAKRRDDSIEVGELKRLVTVLLQEIDGWPASGLLVAATNHHDLLDPAVWRRFDLVVEFSMPTEMDVKRAVQIYLGNASENKRWIDVLIPVFIGSSYADIERDLKRIRRQSIVLKEPLEKRLKEFIAERVNGLKRSDRARLALSLVDVGFSQREAHDWTGVSRDTIRKHHDTGSRTQWQK
ncbi:MAG: AAA family ATPase [Nitrospira sp.]|nr:AAA family ATPase [Nitrospira sp.]